jgi:hypothetical protein
MSGISKAENWRSRRKNNERINERNQKPRQNQGFLIPNQLLAQTILTIGHHTILI